MNYNLHRFFINKNYFIAFQTEKSGNNPTPELQLDKAAVTSVLSEAAKRTEGASVERLERLLAALVRIVEPFSANWNRLALSHELLKCLDQMCPATRKKQSSPKTMQKGF